MRCKYCGTEKSNRYIRGYCNACWQRFYKRGCFKLRQYQNSGATKHPLYRTWTNMKTRCYNKGNRSYQHYGNRGIKVCSRWLEKPGGFWNFVQDMSKRPEGYSLDRIDVNGDYCKENCRWASPTQQALNRRQNNEARGVCQTPSGYKAYVTFNGKTQSKRFKNSSDAAKWRLSKEKELGIKV